MTRRLLLVEDVARELVERSEAAAPDETGGILLGVIGDRVPWILRAIEVPSACPAPSWYEIPGGITQRLVLTARALDPRLGYLGDWHSHPADVGTSWQDWHTHRRALSFAWQHGETRPLMLVMRLSKGRWTIEAAEGRRMRFLARTYEPILTGPAPGSGLVA